MLRRKNQLAIKNLLESTQLQRLSNASAERKAVYYYRACMDVNKTTDHLGSKPLTDLLSQLFGISWVPGNVTDFNVSAWNFQRTLELTQALGLDMFFNVWVSEDDKQPTHNILQVDQGGLSLQRDQYINKSIEKDKTLSAYWTFLTDLGVLLGGDRNVTLESMLNVIRLEQRIADVSAAYADRRDVERMYNRRTIRQLQQLAPFLNWKQYFNNILNVTSYQVNESEPIIVKEPEFLRQVSQIVLQMMSTTDGRRTLNSYLLSRVMKTFSSYLSKPFQKIKDDFIRVLFGSSGEEEHWSSCVANTEGVLPFAVGAMFVRHEFDVTSKQTAEEMIDYIKNAFKNNMHKLDWMNEKTKKVAFEKADAMKNLIGFPQFILNVSQLDERYKELEADEDKHFDNNLRAVRYFRKRNFDKLRKTSEKNSWTTAPSSINAYYTPTRNEIIFLAGILQAPFFDKEYPKYLNYGGVGVVMGHELTHGFDDQGREYDKFGVLQSWWGEESIARFKQRAQCFDDQYSAYTAYGENLRGRQTLGENIADSGGLKAAFYAYKDWTSKHGREPTLPAVNLTNEQLFFVAFAQVWCTNSRAEDSRMSIMGDSHSLPEFRVRGSVSNSPEFAEQFTCAPGTPMNPGKKCEVW